MIQVDNRGRVFVTTDKISPQDANNALLLGRRNDDSATHRVDITLIDPNDNNLTSNDETASGHSCKPENAPDFLSVTLNRPDILQGADRK